MEMALETDQTEGSAQLPDGSEPVSYTHLDVYKRQQVYCNKKIIIIGDTAMQIPGYFEDMNHLHVNTEPDRAYYIPCLLYTSRCV